MKTLVVLAPDGRYIPGYGSRPQGGKFELPDDVAQAYADQYPDDYALETPPQRGGKKKEDGDE